MRGTGLQGSALFMTRAGIERISQKYNFVDLSVLTYFFI